MSNKPLVNRIPSEELGEYTAWQLPEIDSRGNIVPSAEREVRARQVKAASEALELEEDVTGEHEIRPITAEMLREITEAAEREGAQRGYQEGFTKGLEEGRAQGLNETRRQIQDQQQRLAGIAAALFKPVREQDDALEKLLLDMVCTLTRSILKRELQTDSSQILAIVQQAIAALPVGDKNLTVHLNPDDLALVEAFAEENGKEWRFIGDTSLLPGGCRLETRDSLVDYTVEGQLELLLEQFLSKQLAGDEAEVADRADQTGGVKRE